MDEGRVDEESHLESKSDRAFRTNARTCRNLLADNCTSESSSHHRDKSVPFTDRPPALWPGPSAASTNDMELQSLEKGSFRRLRCNPGKT